MPAQQSNVFGVPAVQHSALADQLAFGGLHHSSPNYSRALMTARSAAPARRARIIAALAPPAPAPVPLPPLEPSASVAAALTGTALGRLADSAAEQIEQLDTWFMRSVLLGEMLHSTASTHNFRQILTVALEAVYEPAVCCLEQAFWLTVCLHPTWRDAGTEWLHPHAGTWLTDWLRPQPELLAWAKRAIAGDLAACEAAA